MTRRHRSRDGTRDSDAMLGAEGTVSQQGRFGGRLQRDIASADEHKRAYARPAGKTRITKAKEADDA